MNKYIDFGRLPITESEVNDTLFGIRDDGELVRCSYYIKPQIDTMMNDQKTELSTDISELEEKLSNQIKKVRKETVDLLGEANNALSNI